MDGFFRRPRISDARPPALPARASARCVVCGHRVSPDQAIDRGRGIQHLVCEPRTVSDLARRLAAARAIHGAFEALGSIPALKPAVEGEVARMPDVIDANEALASLARLRTAVELASFPTPERRRLALALLDGLVARVTSANRPSAPPSAPTT